MNILATIVDHLAGLYPDTIVGMNDDDHLGIIGKVDRGLILLLLNDDCCALLHDAERKFGVLLGKEMAADLDELIYYALRGCETHTLQLPDPQAITQLEDLVRKWWQ